MYKPYIVAHPHKYQELFYYTGVDTSMFGINLTILDILEIIHTQEVLFQRRCKIVMTTTYTASHFNHVSFNVYHRRRKRVPFMRISYRNADTLQSCENFVITLVDVMSLVCIADIVKKTYHMPLVDTVKYVF